MSFFSGPRSLKSELQILFLCVGSAFLVLATILLFQNGQAALRRQILGTATTAAETAASLIAVEDHQLIRTPADMNTPGFRTIVTNLGALRRANPSIYHLFTLAPLGQLGRWGVVVDMGGTAPVLDEGELRRGRLPIGSPPPASVPPELIVRGMSGTNAEILDITHPEKARVVAVSPIRTVGGASVGLVVVELSASSLISEARLLWYVSIGVFLLGLVASVLASTFVSRWVTRPIENLLKGVEEIAKGNLSARVAVDLQANELGALAGAFNHMAEGLEVSQTRNVAHQSRLHQLHRLGSSAASTLELRTILDIAAGGLRAICGGTEAFAGASTRRETGRPALGPIRPGRGRRLDVGGAARPPVARAGRRSRLLSRPEISRGRARVPRIEAGRVRAGRAAAGERRAARPPRGAGRPRRVPRRFDLGGLALRRPGLRRGQQRAETSSSSRRSTARRASSSRSRRTRCGPRSP